MNGTRQAVFPTIADAISDTLSCADIPALTDEDLLAVVAEVEGVGRRVDALRVTLAGEIADRSRPSRGLHGLAASRASRTPAELLERITRTSGVTARRRIRLAADLRRDPFPGSPRTKARFDRVAGAVEAGTLGMDAAGEITHGLTPLLAHSSVDELAAAERELVAAATGASAECPVACGADEVRIMAGIWRARIDPDGLDPAEDRAMTGRGIQVGRERGGLVPVRSMFLAEAAGRLITLFDAYMTPTTALAFLSAEERAAHEAGKDPRTPAQQRHDILIGIIDTMARSKDVPTIGGQAPTVLVSVRAEDLNAGRGAGWAERVQGSVSMRTVKQLVCTGGTQQVVLNTEGRILSLGSAERCFTYQQRRAITLRDGGCLIPGCRIPAGWCEIHHVVPDRDGGPTHTDNGVLLCWFHHHTIDTSGWQIRMTRGVPEIKAPPWIEYFGRWRPATKSRTTLTRRLPLPPPPE